MGILQVLIQFSVENFRSIRERQTLSMTASRYFKDMEDTNTLDAGLGADFPRLLRVAAIYGPNAGGKSSLVLAMNFMAQMVIGSTRGAQSGETLEVEPFAFSARNRAADSEFEIAIIVDGVRYQYGFRANARRVTEEWLFAYPNGHLQKWYQRAYDIASGQDMYKFSPSLAGGRRKSDWKDQTRSNALFLSTAVQLNNEQLKPVFEWFQKRLTLLGISGSSTTQGYTNRVCMDDAAHRRRVVEFMNLGDLGIEDLNIRPHRPSDAADLASRLPDALASPIKDVQSEVTFLHRDVESGDLIGIDERYESDGTRELYAFAGPWLDVLDNNRVSFVDELDTSLHPLIVHQLVGLLQKQASGAQLIFTSHDTSILNQRILRRDQIWFVERGLSKATKLYSLADFSVREQEAVEKGYLGGRYGAIPFVTGLESDGSQ